MQYCREPAVLVAFAAATTLSLRAYRRKSLTPAGCAAAWVCGFVTTHAGCVPFAALVTFFFTCTAITKAGAARKRAIEDSYHESGNRSAWQVLCNGASATALLVAAGLGWWPRPLTSAAATAVQLAVVAHYAACQGDTWSSELGVLSRSTPRLVLGGRKVPTGTNGGVTLAGLGAALAGGAVLGLACAGASALQSSGVIPFVAESPAAIPPATLLTTSVVAALAGSLLDSVLGQLFQASYYDPSTRRVSSDAGPGKEHVCGVAVLSNNAVNAITAFLVTAGTYWYYSAL